MCPLNAIISSSSLARCLVRILAHFFTALYTSSRAVLEYQFCFLHNLHKRPIQSPSTLVSPLEKLQLYCIITSQGIAHSKEKNHEKLVDSKEFKVHWQRLMSFPYLLRFQHKTWKLDSALPPCSEWVNCESEQRTCKREVNALMENYRKFISFRWIFSVFLAGANNPLLNCKLLTILTLFNWFSFDTSRLALFTAFFFFLTSAIFVNF